MNKHKDLIVKRNLSEKANKEIEEARKRIKSGKFLTHEEIENRFGL